MQMGVCVKLVVLKLSVIKQEDFNFKTLLIWMGLNALLPVKEKRDV